MIVLFLAEGFEEIEALATLDILRRAGLTVQTVGVPGREVKGAHGVTVTADVTAGEIDTDGVEMVVLPGGPGTPNLEASETVQRFIDYAVQNDLWLGAICAAPSILGHKGLLAGKKAVCYPGYEPELKGAQVGSTSVSIDGRIITGNGPGASFAFGLELAAALAGREKAEQVKSGMQIR
ncbi:DJ-1 family glyoxalase III [Ethanoligenens harbinense]|uniref:DJ-1 family protein n=1 Tax=Ethanoligenens harbinense (strain DSM 18485 / JCM 12961 / CGMCC 1.5033 / YUAN-3) TaxID=663278 RepID=E6U7I4_ETHHY|nr:DJ-1 family glyoxalase III [Ethanoligenens harbinense]ADU27007.1 DJ-1 family protein [Ethanoligenens harbinense YUAN-3]AVQ96094.1 DJ-1 family protein [Ethanoligenens harbinense YUAN-3]AYF38755.1 DJ-1 family protein [Ethanoligenens harbinense]AYF41503.1 DJ-1 family protein [Ethanoligenens harbinense]QCN92335.1 DJ-1 family protein [Ethanoligenens harbinense]